MANQHAETEFVVRFIVYFNGENRKPYGLVLGYGYMDDGTDHQNLNRLYRKHAGEEGRIYAGYLKVRGPHIRIHKGGSQTLNIPRDDELDRELREFFESDSNRAVAIASQFELVLANKVPHCLMRF